MARDGGPGPDISGGHIGLVVTAIALGVVAHFSGIRWALIVAGCCTAWFLLALAVIHVRGGRGGQALRRAYVATFGWGDYVNP
ncbi:hypothetical protein [Streptomyces viridosporus]|uniref:hypothetical protein n=1 Tax=Streptomyces viridosporus TaxID=67581 RepID=UPI0037035895